MASAMPFSDLKKNPLKVDEVAGDKLKWEIRSRGADQCANARFMAFCRLFGTGEILNPLVYRRNLNE
jgi:hypothetical protein